MDAKKLFEFKQERAKITASLRALMSEFEDKEMPAEKKGEQEKYEARFDELNVSILSEERQLERERAAGEIAQNAVHQTTNNEMRQLFAKALSGDPRHMQEYQNALSLGTGAAAGDLTAPMEFVQDLIKGLDNIMFMRQISNVVGPIGDAQSLGFPYRSTEATDATWTGEVDAAAEETALQYSRREFKPRRMAKLIKMSNALISHAPMAETVVRDEMQYRISASAESSYMTGAGQNCPLGIFVASDSGIPATRDVSADNTATKVTFDGLQNAKYGLKQQYLFNASWVMHRDLCKMIAKIKGADEQYIWQGSTQNGQPDLLLGHPVYMSEYAPNTYTTGLYAAVFGNFKAGYWICDADVLTLQVLKELYAVNNQIGYLLNYFGDGAPVLGEAFTRVKLG